MDNEKILEGFFRALRVTLTNSFSYSKDHPYFIKSVENFKVKLEEALAVLDPLNIGITSSGIVVGGKNLTKSGFFEELAHLLHQRKIKTIEIRSGITLEELIQFLSVVSLPQKDVFKGGGINAILGKSKPVHLTIEELDYSVFLHGQGSECNDLWGYMLKEAVYSDDTVKLERIADEFGQLIKQSSGKDICEGEDLPANINEFLFCLKERNKEKFDKCAKDVFLWLMHNKKFLDAEKLEKLKPIFDCLDQEDFSAFLWEGILHEDNFDALSLNLFSKISEHRDTHKITEKFLSRTDGAERLKNNPSAVRRVQNLLTSPQGEDISPVYRNILESLVKGITPSGILSFDKKVLRQNYHYILLSLFSVSEDQDNLKFIAELLEKELPVIFEDNDIDFLKELHSFLAREKNDGMEVCIELENKLSAFIENIVLNQSLPVQQEFLLDMVSSATQDINYYLDKIFAPLDAGVLTGPSSGKINKQVLMLFFKLFPQQMDVFYPRLEQKITDMDFLGDLIDSLSQLDERMALPVLEYIYSSANELIKSETLKAMRKFEKVDVDFLLRQLGTNSLSLRKNLFSVLMLDDQGQLAALDLLFKIPSPWGRRNNLLIENMQIVFDLKITKAASWIRELAKKRFFWNRKLRNKAKQILGEWNVC
ncbi:MAG: hypothetical protein PHC29_06315 [Candidatus Omnitrophica bacterium]|nr:hypothetical protein [Candidatus Omnitrophota bacterium]